MKLRSLSGLTPGIVRELLEYDPSTGAFFFKKRGAHWFKTQRVCNSWNSRCAGKRADRLWRNNKNGYQRRVVQLLGKYRKAHHLAWIWMTDDPLPEQIDHHDQDATNNMWTNLKGSSRSENMKNRSKNKNNTSGVTGVSWSKRDSKWTARCHVGGKNHFLGQFDSIEDAAQAVAGFRSLNNFSPNHGADIAHYHKRKA